MTIKCTGQGNRQYIIPNKYGFARGYRPQVKTIKGFTGDIVKAVVTTGKKAGTYIGRVGARSRGSFNISTRTGTVTDISYKNCKKIQSCDAYSYSF